MSTLQSFLETEKRREAEGLPESKMQVSILGQTEVEKEREGSMRTTHKIIFGDSRKMEGVADNSVDLTITSPPYPMIEMWDKMFSEQNPEIGSALNQKDGNKAFELMHQELDKVWEETYRVLRNGGIACVNIGDATRTLNGTFQVYANHSRILNHCLKLGFHALPHILWVKETNKPNKFMGSGMMPPGAYVTLEHEYIIILRKDGKREFATTEEKERRKKSAFFWEERNVWFSDKWNGIKGTLQNMNNAHLRERSAAYPFELVYRLISMYSIQGDTVLDPFLGTGTSTLGAMATGRNSIGIEIDPNFKDSVEQGIKSIAPLSNNYTKQRLQNHIEFVQKREGEKGPLKYVNKHYGFPVITRQEIEMVLLSVQSINQTAEREFEVIHNRPSSSLVSTVKSPSFFA